MEVEVGKRYVREDMKVTGGIIRDETGRLFDPKHKVCYGDTGGYWFAHGGHPADLVREYHEGFKVGDRVRRKAGGPGSEVIGLYEDVLWLIHTDGSCWTVLAGECVPVTTKYRIAPDDTLYDTEQEARNAVKIEEVEG